MREREQHKFIKVTLSSPAAFRFKVSMSHVNRTFTLLGFDSAAQRTIWDYKLSSNVISFNLIFMTHGI